MGEETEGDMAAAELAAEAERDNTPAPLPPCGPERDRLAAEAVGWEWPATVAIGPETTRVRYPSTTHADALALLEAWVEAWEPGSRKYRIERWVDGHFSVYLWPVGFEWTACHGPTLGDAATAAAIRGEAPTH